MQSRPYESSKTSGEPGGTWPNVPTHGTATSREPDASSMRSHSRSPGPMPGNALSRWPPSAESFTFPNVSR